MMHHISCGMLIREGRVLLVHRAPSKKRFPNVWDFPGGHLEPVETGQEALVRELREELGVTIAPPAAQALLTRRHRDMVQTVWLVETWEGEIFNAAPQEHDALGWFTLTEALSLNVADASYAALFEKFMA